MTPDLPREDRRAFLREACGDDAALREEVEALLSESKSVPLERGVHEAMRETLRRDRRFAELMARVDAPPPIESGR